MIEIKAVDEVSVLRGLLTVSSTKPRSGVPLIKLLWLLNSNDAEAIFSVIAPDFFYRYIGTLVGAPYRILEGSWVESCLLSVDAFDSNEIYRVPFKVIKVANHE